MAVIGKIRKHSGLLIVLIGIAILGFVVQDAFSSRNSKISPLAKINGTVITYNDFQGRVENLEMRYRQAQGQDIALTSQDMEQIRNMAWEQMLSEVLLSESYDNLGLKVSPAEMNDLYYGDFISQILFNVFTNPQTGMYDREYVKTLINQFDQLSDQDKKTLSDIEKAVKSERLREKYYYMLEKSMYTPKTIAEMQLHNREDGVDAEYIRLNYADISDADVKVTNKDFSDYYQQNKHLFKQEESRSIHYIALDILPTAQDVQDLETEANQMFEEMKMTENISDLVNAVSTIAFDSLYDNRKQVPFGWDSLFFNASKGTYFPPRRIGETYQMGALLDIQMRPDSVRISHIMITHKGGNPQSLKTKEEARKVADSLVQVLKNNPSQFEVLAAQYSEDPSVTQNGGDMAWQREGYFLPAFNEMILKSKVGDVKVVETPMAYHVVKLTGKTADVKKVLGAVISLPIVPSEATYKAVYTEANKILAESGNLAQLDSACKHRGLFLRKAEYVSELSSQLAGLSNAREIVRWAYGKDVKEGSVAQEIYEIDEKYVIAGLKEIRKEGYISLEKLKTLPQVEYMVKRDVKAKMLEDKIAAVKAGNLKDLAKALNTEVMTANNVNMSAYSFGADGFEPKVIGSVCGMKENVLSAPIRGNSGVYMVQVLAKKPADVASMVADYQRQLTQTEEQGIFSLIQSTSQSLAEIEDNRALYY